MFSAVDGSVTRLLLRRMKGLDFRLFREKARH